LAVASPVAVVTSCDALPACCVGGAVGDGSADEEERDSWLESAFEAYLGAWLTDSPEPLDASLVSLELGPSFPSQTPGGGFGTD
jgi:hypothetical protein